MNALVTVVTPCYNSAQFIEETIQSVLSQTYAPIEYIVMDGSSTDGTQAIVQRYADRLMLISEQDRGQSDAINKGWQMAQGEVLAWLNADDLYFPDTVARAVAFLADNPDVQWLYGNGDYIAPDGTPSPLRHPNTVWDYTRLLTVNDYIVQPTVFLRRQVVEEMGYLCEDLHFTMDYEYWLRIGQRYPGRLVPDVRVQVKRYRDTKTASGGLKRLAEMEAMLKVYGATDLPAHSHLEWAESNLAVLLQHFQDGDRVGMREALRALGRYPDRVPRALAKTAMMRLFPEAWETRLRQWLLRER